MSTEDDDNDKILDANPELTYVADRLTILRAAFAALRKMGITPDVGDVLEVASWLAGDEQHDTGGTIVGIYSPESGDDD